MLLVIDAGNTNIVFAVREGDHWRGTWRIATDPQRFRPCSARQVCCGRSGPPWR